MLAKLGEMTLLEWVLYRLKKASQANSIHLLTSREPGNELLAEIANSLNIETFFGEESDVASRFSEAARRWPADNYVRVCADNPFISKAASIIPSIIFQPWTTIMSMDLVRKYFDLI
jgi:spore coat polysaccharide biosynthesis protein SpsF